MRIVQSFWSCNKSLTKDGFGWLTPQYHIMAWTLSCLKLKEHYDDLHLYTDTNGSSVLIDYLKLPYKKVHRSYDKLNQHNENLWALPKIMTYAAQDVPFIHVDGDVFIWDKFDGRLEGADLIAQNFETGTQYYKRHMDEVRKEIKYIPNLLRNELNKESISSYNAGIFGGNDLSFIKSYCVAALKLVEKNYPGGCNDIASANFNILFEQILFYCLSNAANKKVACFYPESVEDNGYGCDQFSDFTVVPYRLKYLHLIGGKKRKNEICTLMSRILFQEYPEYFYKITALFKDDHTNFDKKIKPFFERSVQAHLPKRENADSVMDLRKYCKTQQAINLLKDKMQVWTSSEIIDIAKNSDSTLVQSTFLFESQLADLLEEWTKIPAQELVDLEEDASRSWLFMNCLKEERLNLVLKINPYLEIIEDSFDWHMEVKQHVNENLINGLNEILGLAYIPQLFFMGHSAIVIDELDFNLLVFLQQPITFKCLLQDMQALFVTKDKVRNREDIYNLAVMKLQKLIIKKCVLLIK